MTTNSYCILCCPKCEAPYYEKDNLTQEEYCWQCGYYVHDGVSEFD